jgi:peptidoglycan/xylan/chitin deacetylase (PgdA/CDA1 family)
MTHDFKIKNFGSFAQIIRMDTLLQWNKLNLIFPFYHTVSDVDLPHITNLYHVKTPKEFISDLDYLLQHYIPISLNELISGNLDSHKKYMHLSFDDGLKQVSEIIAPILKGKGIPASFFINPSYVNNKDIFFRYEVSMLLNQINQSKQIQGKQKEQLTKQLRNMTHADISVMESLWGSLSMDRKEALKKQTIYMSESDLERLHSEGFHIGAHSMTHVRFSEISEKIQIQEIQQSLEWIEQRYPSSLRSFAFPYSDDGVGYHRIREIQQILKLDCSFGTSGICNNGDFHHYQRVPMEHQLSYSASRIIKSELLVASITRKMKAKNCGAE